MEKRNFDSTDEENYEETMLAVALDIKKANIELESLRKTAYNKESKEEIKKEASTQKQ